MTFQPGQSGNPRGKPPGTKSHRSREMDRYRQLAAKELIRHVKRGNVTALALLLERTHPKPRSVAPLAKIKGAQTTDLARLGRRVLRAITTGRISADVGHTMLAAISLHTNVTTATDLERDIAAMEAADEETGISTRTSSRRSRADG